MWSYYGSKRKIEHLYPFPEYEEIIEPFAGAANYSLYHHRRKVTLIEVNPIIYGLWKYILEDCTLKDIESWPDLEVGQSLRDIRYLSSVEKNLLGFCTSKGNASPGFVVSKFAKGSPWDKLPSVTPNMGRKSAIYLLKQRLRYYLPRIRHWKIYNISYKSFRPNPQATWFIDPPYNNSAGKRYPFSDIDYSYLSAWCLKRNGQIIVCENVGATWMPFTPIAPGRKRGLHLKSSEAIFCRNS